MTKLIKNIFIIFLKYWLNLLSGLVSIFFNSKNNKIIVINSIRYNDNSRYLFEYLAKRKDFHIYWVTNDKNIRDYLLRKKLNCAYGFWQQLKILPKAKIAVYSGMSFDDRFNFLRKKTIRYCLNHGVGPKITLRAPTLKKTLSYMKLMHASDYCNFTSEYTSHIIGRIGYKLPSKKIITLGYPRIDHLFKGKKIEAKKNIKKLIKNLGIKHKVKKIILYSPTWREDNKKELPIYKVKKFNLEKFNSFLRKKNFLFIYTTHPNSNFEKIRNCDRIKYLNTSNLPLFDINLILSEIDLLITDYSTLSTDFSILKKPQLFILNDFKEYFKNESLLEDTRKSLPGDQIETYNELIKNLNDYLIKRKKVKIDKIKDFQKNYYDYKLKNSCQKHFIFLKKIMKY